MTKKIVDLQELLAKEGRECPRCMDMVIKIRRGELTGVILSCHPLDLIVDADLQKYVESREMSNN